MAEMDEAAARELVETNDAVTTYSATAQLYVGKLNKLVRRLVVLKELYTDLGKKFLAGVEFDAPFEEQEQLSKDVEIIWRIFLAAADEYKSDYEYAHWQLETCLKPAYLKLCKLAGVDPPENTLVLPPNFTDLEKPT